MIVQHPTKNRTKIVVSEILDQVAESDSWKILLMYTIFQESDCETWSKISETTIFCQILVRLSTYSKILYVFHKILCLIFSPEINQGKQSDVKSW